MMLTRRWRFLSVALTGAVLTSAFWLAAGAYGQRSDSLSGDRVVRVGVVLPLPVNSTVRSLVDVQAAAARSGAVMGLDDAARRLAGYEPQLRMASAPNASAAGRAAERLIAVDGVVALIGGVGQGQAAILSDIAEEHGVPFINIADQGVDIRASCRAMTFHVEADRSTYLSALAMELGTVNFEHVAIVHVDSPESAYEASSLGSSLHGHFGTEVRLYSVAESTMSFQSLLEDIADDGNQAVLLLLPSSQQDSLLLQAAWTTPELEFRLFPTSESQSRYALASQRLSTTLATAPRIALWDASIQDQADQDGFNRRFLSRFAAPADPAAWAAYQAVGLVFDGVAAHSTAEPKALARYFLEEWPGSIGKPSAARFRKGDHQLIQDLYVVKVDPAAPWTSQVSSQVAIASVVAVLSADELEDFAPPETGICEATTE